MAKPFASIPASERDFEIRRAVDTLIEAQRIKKDKVLMKAVRPKLKEMAQAAQTAAKTI